MKLLCIYLGLGSWEMNEHSSTEGVRENFCICIIVSKIKNKSNLFHYHLKIVLIIQVFGEFANCFLATKIFNHYCWGFKFIVSVNEVLEGNLKARFSSTES